MASAWASCCAAMAALAFPAVPDAGTAATSWNEAVEAYPGLRIPRVWTTVNDTSKAPGYIFLTPRARVGQRTGPTILDAQGRVVWFHKLSRARTAIGLRPQTYLGKPVVTWGQRPPLGEEGDLYTGTARTVYNVVADQRYKIIARVRARGRDINTDLHEFEISRRNTALVLGFRTINRDLRRYGGVEHSAILDNVVQEIDIATGKVLFSWSAARRISPRDSYIKPPDEGGWDAYHINSVSEDLDGNLLITGRHTHTVYKIERRTGRVVWKLGGKDSDFRVSDSARFFYAHDATRGSDGTLTVFDNRATFLDKSHGASRAVRIRIDMKRKTASLARAFHHPSGNVQSTSQGNARMLDGGNVFVGWGSSPWFSEYAADGHLVFAGHFQSQWNQSYRAFKAPWTGRPVDDPAAVAFQRHAKLTVYAAWNGATDVAQWRVRGGAGGSALELLGSGPWQGFETKLSFDAQPALLRVEALNAAGEVIGTSALVEPGK